MNHRNAFLKVSLIFLWIGFVCAISFMEAWLKFTAQGVTLPVGLSIGQVVFEALNKVELAIGALISVLVISSKEHKMEDLAFALAVLILLSEAFWLLPLLSSRIELILSGATPEKSNLHFLFIMMEVAKVLALLIYGINQMNYGKYKTTHTWANCND
jgi:hypothetical protein